MGVDGVKCRILFKRLKIDDMPWHLKALFIINNNMQLEV